MTKNIISIYNLSKEYTSNNNSVVILKDISFKLYQGDIVSIVGPSGSGKSTFLNILGLLDSSFKGQYDFLDKNIKYTSNDQKNIIRNNSIGFVHQFFHLIPELNVLENVTLPNLIQCNKVADSVKKAKSILTNFDLQDKILSKPHNLSGGEQQRVAIARALINKPSIIIADEMTGNLDEKISDSIFNFFLEQVRINNQSLIYVTHNNHYAKQANMKYQILNQKLKQI
ncbi:MAG TPA: ABC transporter ATP-binding protein [Pelagibacterales bacterium]|jgi:ABC-type lipoprotein export system ATPase subunit|nr:ABC transporter ATP-binding protein [Alphaproteobacteria bacterium]PPR57460.1 MAG: Lipoprotein-releasing system ATP-binding protein LolD [Alphaproteobacteria bacterium MarineAlpha5_Bin3]HIC42332.1 ABC transporter ATP-binding protein [Pelagibacterales bacterium]